MQEYVGERKYTAFRELDSHLQNVDSDKLDQKQGGSQDILLTEFNQAKYASSTTIWFNFFLDSFIANFSELF